MIAGQICVFMILGGMVLWAVFAPLAWAKDWAYFPMMAGLGITVLGILGCALIIFGLAAGIDFNG